MMELMTEFFLPKKTWWAADMMTSDFDSKMGGDDIYYKFKDNDKKRLEFYELKYKNLE